MNQKQKRQRVNRIRNIQKKVREVKRPKSRVITREDLVGLFTMTKRFARNCQQLILGRQRLLRISALGGMISVSFFVFFLWATISGIIYIPIEERVGIFTITFIAAISPWILYFSLNDSWMINHWKKNFQENSEFAKNIENRLQEMEQG